MDVPPPENSAMVNPALRESDVVVLMEFIRERTLLELELKHCRERLALYRNKPAQVLLGGNLAAGERIPLPAAIAVEPIIRYLMERIAALNKEIRARGVIGDKPKRGTMTPPDKWLPTQPANPEEAFPPPPCAPHDNGLLPEAAGEAS
jgi:hypothetical protein